MNIPAFLIATAMGAAFLAVEYRWYYQPDMVSPDALMSTFSGEHIKARAAVRHALIDPDSAKFGTLRSVLADGTRYVCGGVQARDRSGHFIDAAFVYAVAVDFARIDDGGRITRQQSGFRPCPAEEDKIAQQTPTLSPGVSSLIKTVQKVAPQADTSAASALTTFAPSGGGASSSGTMEQQIRELAARTVPADSTNGQQASPMVKRDGGKESDLRVDQPAAAWPTFPPGHPLTKPTRTRTPSEALALAKDVEERIKQAELSGDITTRPSSDEIKEACRALLTIDPADREYREAWAAFLQLQKRDRDDTTAAKRSGVEP
ncbi:hypothetical protein IVA88_22600 [Bradyrhizobium sp. 149]|uniref:hypothetical protein n=1 Tax=Bradyrhizobium sp. 149 TaxID=2782624 RepID=UPI001FF7B203|nr:hypothetical protein [Bradyrhizobium sp. 149]MCK1654207.1 hypothetical protein [Bradyrhizobium sp. 149]